MRLQARDEVHVVLRQHFQQRVEGLAELRVVLQRQDQRSRVKNSLKRSPKSKVTKTCEEVEHTSRSL